MKNLLSISFSKFVKIYLKRNKATFDDDYFKLKSAKTEEFFCLNKVISDIGSYSEDIVYKASIYLDPSKDIYQRKVFTIMDLFGVIGGIYGLLVSSLGLLVGFISSNVFLSSIFRRLYYVSASQSTLENTLKKKLDHPGSKAFDKSREEIKEHLKTKLSNSDFDGSRPFTEINIQPDDSQLVEGNSVHTMLVTKIAKIVQNRQKYQASCWHKILTLAPSCI